MAEDERLREALTELQALRVREELALKDSAALLSGLSAVSRAATVEGALGTLCSEAIKFSAAEHAMVLGFESGAARVLARSPGCPVVEPEITPRSVRKPRNVLRVAGLDEWAQFAEAGVNSILSVPLRRGSHEAAGLICLHSKPVYFSNQQRVLLRQIADLAVPVLSALELQARNGLLAGVIDGAATGFVVFDGRAEDRAVAFVNQAFVTATGISVAEAVGRPGAALMAGLTSGPGSGEMQRAIRDGIEGRFVVSNHGPDGAQHWTEFGVFPVYDAEGAAEYIVATQTDVSDKVSAEEAMELNRARLIDALSGTPDAFLLLSAAGRVLYANEAMGRMFPAGPGGWADGQEFYHSWGRFVAGQWPDHGALPEGVTRPDLVEVARSDKGRELPLPGGRVLLVRALPTSEGGFALSATDVTPMKRVERELRQKVAAIESASDGIGIIDAAGRITYANQSLITLQGAADEAGLLGREWARGYVTRGVNLALGPLLQQVALEGRGTTRFDVADPDFKGAVHEVTLSDGGKAGHILIVRDVSAQVEDMRRRVELSEQLEVLRQEQAISVLAAGLAHDFNNLLSALNGSAVLISSDDNATGEIREHADRILAAGNQAAQLVNQLLDLGKGRRAKGMFDLGTTLRKALELLESHFAASTVIGVELPEEAITLCGHESDLSQVVINLVLNAGDALPDQVGEIGVRARMVGGADQDLILGDLVAGADYALIEVSDSGTGIDAADRDRIFEAYFSTKGDQGTGLGLASVAATVQRVGGAIALITAPGEGSRFRVFWPLETRGEGAVVQVKTEGAADLSGRLIMVVDDEEQVGALLGSMLEGMGAEVAVVSDPALALESITEDPGAWSAVISDYNMGEMNGGDLVVGIRAVAPQLPVFILTALARRFSDPRITTRTVQGVFAKPADMCQISHAIAEHT